MKALKDAKRRVVQKAAEKFRNAEHVSKDEEAMNMYVEAFKTFEAEVKELNEALKQVQSMTQKWTEKNLVLAERLSNFFSTEDTPMKQSSFQMSACALKAHEVIQRSAARVVEDHAMAVLDGLLNERFPAIKKRITAHRNAEIDVSAYTNRLKHLTEKKTAGDPEMVKAKEKLDAATAVYDQLHDELLNELKNLSEEKHNILKPVLAAILGSYSQLHSGLSEGYDAASNAFVGPELQEVKREMSNWIDTGGPPAETAPRSTLSMKNLFNKSNASTLRSHRSEQQGGSNLNSSTLNASMNTSMLNTSMMSTASTNNVPSSPKGGPYFPAETTTDSSAGPTDSKEFGEALSEEVSQSQQTETKDADGPSVNATQFAPDAICEAVFDYEGPDPGDLSFKKGDRITMSVEVSPGWWNGTREIDGSYGLFPETYVTRVG